MHLLLQLDGFYFDRHTLSSIRLDIHRSIVAAALHLTIPQTESITLINVIIYHATGQPFSNTVASRKCRVRAWLCTGPLEVSDIRRNDLMQAGSLDNRD
jgi:hypothetical protein